MSGTSIIAQIFTSLKKKRKKKLKRTSNPKSEKKSRKSTNKKNTGLNLQAEWFYSVSKTGYIWV